MQKIIRKGLKEKKKTKEQSYPGKTPLSWWPNQRAASQVSLGGYCLGSGVPTGCALQAKFSPQGFSVGLVAFLGGNTTQIIQKETQLTTSNSSYDSLVGRRTISPSRASYLSAGEPALCSHLPFYSRATFHQLYGFRWSLQKPPSGNSPDTEITMFFTQYIGIQACAWIQVLSISKYSLLFN